MPTPIPERLSSVLRSDSTAALAALMVIASAHRDLFNWAIRMVGAEPTANTAPKPKQARRAQNTHVFHGKQVRKPNGAGRPAKTNRSGADAYHQRQREARDRDDQALLEAMRVSPEGSIGDWMSAAGKGRSSILSALKRLREAGLAESIEGKWRLTEPDTPREPPPKWTAPVRGSDRAAHPHLT